jgi:hypothetical protein
MVADLIFMADNRKNGHICSFYYQKSMKNAQKVFRICQKVFRINDGETKNSLGLIKNNARVFRNNPPLFENNLPLFENCSCILIKYMHIVTMLHATAT